MDVLRKKTLGDKKLVDDLGTSLETLKRKWKSIFTYTSRKSKRSRTHCSNIWKCIL
ncbi:hypothetical protein Q5M85_01955 [Paraclostridium bifermentans]|nr:hypothetical protein [Paraclostridium bifermentans]